MTAWTPRELAGWRNTVLKGPNTLFLMEKVQITHQQHSLYPEVFRKFQRVQVIFGKKLIVCVDLLSLDQSKTFYKPDWFDIVGEEVKCCKEAVCVIDMSSFTKFELTVSHNALWTSCSS